MKNHSKASVTPVNCFYGTSTVGERGQLVIPSEARAELGIKAGDKLLMMRHPVHPGLMVFKIESARGFLDEFSAMLDTLEEPGEEKKKKS